VAITHSLRLTVHGELNRPAKTAALVRFFIIHVNLISRGEGARKESWSANSFYQQYRGPNALQFG
jgi:hypothetical protein